MGGIRLRLELDRIPLWRGDHVSIKQLIEDFATYLYLPRLKNEVVLISAIKNSLVNIAVNAETFVYAAGYDDEKKEYRGLLATATGAVFSDSMSLLVKPEIAQAQIERKERERQIFRDSGNAKPVFNPDNRENVPPIIGPQPPIVKPKMYRRFYGEVTIDASRAGKDTSKISEEVISHFTSKIGTNVKVTIHIDARMEEGADEKLMRDISENCKTLNFDLCEFEE